MQYIRRNGVRLAVALGAIGIAHPAFALHQIVYGARTDAAANSATHQGPNVVGSNSHYTNGTSPPGQSYAGNSGSYSGGGSVSQTYAQTSQNGGTNGGVPLHNDAYAEANLATGKLKATTSSTGPDNFGTPGGIASAQLDDTIFFTNTSGSTQTISFTYSFNGLMLNPAAGNPGGNVSLGLSCGGNIGACYNGAGGTGQAITFATPGGSPISLYGGPRSPEDNWNYYFNYNGSSCFGENIYCGQFSASLWEYGTTTPGVGGAVEGYIRAYLNIPTGQTALGVRGSLNLDCRSASSCDFGHTGSFGFGALPTGLTYSSESGVFLTASAAPGAVPEPATWAMTIIGFGLMGASLRTNRRPAFGG